MNEFINVKVEKDDVIDLLVNRVRFWTDNEDVVDLFKKMYENYDEMLDDCNDPYKIGTLTFYPSEILSKCDPVAYRCGISDEISNQIEEAEYELYNYGICEFDKFTFEITDKYDEDDEDDDKE